MTTEGLFPAQSLEPISPMNSAQDSNSGYEHTSGERYTAVTLSNFYKLPQIQKLPKSICRDIEVVGRVLPFKSNRYVIDNLIDWNQVPDDPMFQLTFPQKGMLDDQNYERIDKLLEENAPKTLLDSAIDEIRRSLNPHPAGQMEYNVPTLHGRPLPGMQHKYRETVLFFPSQGQTCHAYCTFCFRWPQFVGMEDKKFAMRESRLLREYVESKPEISDILFTGGDPMIMKTRILANYFAPLLEPDAAPGIRTIRIGTKALSYWPQRFVSDPDADDLLDLFRAVIKTGKHLAIMAHFSHPIELEPPIVRDAIARLRHIGVQIRTQTPLLRHINNDPDILSTMWRRQAQLGCIPYYLFVERDTGAYRYFELPLESAWETFRSAYSKVSGIARTVRGPSMSATPGKVQIVGVSDAGSERVFVLRFLQARNPDWVGRPFFAKYDPSARWLNDLRPAFNEEKFFYESELQDFLSSPGNSFDSQEVPLVAGD